MLATSSCALRGGERENTSISSVMCCCSRCERVGHGAHRYGARLTGQGRIHMRPWRDVVLLIVAIGATAPLRAQSSGAAPSAPAAKPQRPGLFFREEWQQTEKGGEHAVDASSIGNPNLELKLYVPAGEVLLTGARNDETNPIHVWTGNCTTPCAVAFRGRRDSPISPASRASAGTPRCRASIRFVPS